MAVSSTGGVMDKIEVDAGSNAYRMLTTAQSRRNVLLAELIALENQITCLSQVLGLPASTSSASGVSAPSLLPNIYGIGDRPLRNVIAAILKEAGVPMTSRQIAVKLHSVGFKTSRGGTDVGDILRTVTGAVTYDREQKNIFFKRVDNNTWSLNENVSEQVPVKVVVEEISSSSELTGLSPRGVISRVLKQGPLKPREVISKLISIKWTTPSGYTSKEKIQSVIYSSFYMDQKNVDGNPVRLFKKLEDGRWSNVK